MAPVGMLGLDQTERLHEAYICRCHCRNLTDHTPKHLEGIVLEPIYPSHTSSPHLISYYHAATYRDVTRPTRQLGHHSLVRRFSLGQTIRCRELC